MSRNGSSRKGSTPGGNLLDDTYARIEKEKALAQAEAALLKPLWDKEARETAQHLETVQRLAITAEEESARIFLQKSFSDQLVGKPLSMLFVTNAGAESSPTSSVPPSEINSSPHSPAK